MPIIHVSGHYDAQRQVPYLRLLKDEIAVIQLTLAEARSVAFDLLNMAARTEEDATLAEFFSTQQMPDGVRAGMLVKLRDFRAKADAQEVTRIQTDQETGESTKRALLQKLRNRIP